MVMMMMMVFMVVMMMMLMKGYIKLWCNFSFDENRDKTHDEDANKTYIGCFFPALSHCKFVRDSHQKLCKKSYITASGSVIIVICYVTCYNIFQIKFISTFSVSLHILRLSVLRTPPSNL